MSMICQFRRLLKTICKLNLFCANSINFGIFEKNYELSLTCNDRKIQESVNTQIENEINVTVVLPDSSLPSETNGGFATQEEF